MITFSLVYTALLVAVAGVIHRISERLFWGRW